MRSYARVPNLEEVRLLHDERVARARRGEPGAFDELVRAHRDGAFRVARRYAAGDDDAAELVQRAFVKAFEELHRFRGESSFGSWLYRILVNLAMTELRSRKRLVPFDDASGAALEAPAPGEAAGDREQRLSRLEQAVSALPPRQRAVVELRIWSSLSYREIGEALDCSEEAARANFYQAVRKLRTAL